MVCFCAHSLALDATKIMVGKVFVGPIEKWTIGTMSETALFRVFMLIKHLNVWTETVYWPWVTNNIVIPLIK